MIASALVLSLAVCVSSALAAAHTPRGSAYTGPSNAVCTRKTYTINLPSYSSTSFADWVSPTPNQTVITSLFQHYVSSPANFTAVVTPTMETAPISHHDLSGVLCVPKAGDKHEGTVQMLVHGIGFDSSYWDFAYDPDMYSYVKAAVDAGYTTFRYDRLGTGYSEHPGDGYRTVQAPTDLTILMEFTTLLRSGGITGSPVSKIVGIGHSYGSIQFTALTAMAPMAVDALILQGFSANSSYTPIYLTSAAYSVASTVFPTRFGDLPSAYLTTGLPQTSQINFFYYPHFDPAVAVAARETEEPVTQGVLFTFEKLAAGPPSAFKGPVHVVTGDRDWIFCGDQCNIRPPPGNMTILELVGPMTYPMSTDFSVYSPADTGHALNQHYSAPATYANMLGWIEGLGF